MTQGGDLRPTEPVNNYGRSREAAEYDRLRPRSDDRARGTPHGRYDRRRHNTRTPAGGVAVPPKAQRKAMVLGAVTDPWGNGELRTEVAINSRVDLLELERSHRRITEAAYCAGRLAQAIFERLGQTGGSNWAGTSRIDAPTARVHAIVRGLISARAIDALVEQLRGRLGMIDARLLRRVLGERLSYDECACLQGKSGERGQRYVAARFRDALESLAEAWVGRGKVIPTPDDKHKAAAAGMAAREAASIAVGASTARRDAERAAGIDNEIYARGALPSAEQAELHRAREVVSKVIIPPEPKETLQMTPAARREAERAAPTTSAEAAPA